ncbi:MAG TPA: FecR domain-containing protein [Polyangiaceae bacterium]
MVEPANLSASEVSRHWTKLESNLERNARSPIGLYGFAVASTIVILVCIGAYVSRGSPTSMSHPVAEAPSVQPPAPRLPEPSDIALRIHEHETRQLSDGTTVAVSAGGLVAVTHPAPRFTLLELQGGAAEFAVSPRKPGEVLEVSAGRYRFRVLGTRFRVSHAADGVSLAVTEGKVAVLENEQTIRIVPVGGSWSESDGSSQSRTEPAASSAPAASTAHTSDVFGTQTIDCLMLARHHEHEAAISCFAKQATGAGVSAEVAQYEMARIQHDALGQAERSLETLAKYRERFPNGTLRTEAMLKMIQIWVEIGKDHQALEESDRLLQSAQLDSRRGELRFLRGKLYQRRGAFGQALREYDLAAASGDAHSERANLERAGCLEKLGRAEEARKIYEQLSQSQQGTIRDSAHKRLLSAGVERKRAQ